MKSLIKAGLLSATLAGLAVPAVAQPDQGDKDRGSQSDHRGGGDHGNGRGGGGGDRGGRGNDGGGRPAPAAAPAPAPAPPPQASFPRAAPPFAPQQQPYRNSSDDGRGYRQRGFAGGSPPPPPVQQAAPPQAPQVPDRRNFAGDRGVPAATGQPNGGTDRNWQIREDARRAQGRAADARDQDHRGDGRDQDRRGDGRDGNWRGNDGRDNGRNWTDNRDNHGNGGNWRQGQRPPVNSRPPVVNRWNGVRRWDNNSWRNDRRYDWQGWRYSHRNIFRLPRYYAPYGWDWGYTRFATDTCLDDALFGSSYWIGDPWTYHLPPTYGPLHWVRYYNDALLVDVRDGCVIDAIYDLFW